MQRQPFRHGSMPALTNRSTPPLQPSRGQPNEAQQKEACARAERGVFRARRAVRRGTILGALAGAAGFYAYDVSACFCEDSTALAYLSALPTCAVLGGLAGTASATAATVLMPRRRQRKMATACCLLAAVPVCLGRQMHSAKKD